MRLSMDADVVGVPPKVKRQIVLGSMEHLTLDPPQLPPFQKTQPVKNRLVHPRARQIPDSILISGGIAALAGKRQVNIQQPKSPQQRAELDFFMNPVVFLIPVSGKTVLPHHPDILRLTLIPGQNNGLQVIA